MSSINAGFGARRTGACRRERCPHSRGFTLLEVLLALAILAVVMTVIYSAFSAAGTSVDHAEAVRDETDLARTLIARMTTDLTNGYCRSVSEGQFFYGKTEEHDIAGTSSRLDRLALTTLTNWRPPNSKESEIWAVGYFFREKPDGSGYVMMRSEKHITNDEATQEEAKEYEITDEVAGLQIRYWDGSKFVDKEEVGGTESCASQEKAVEITLTMNDGRIFMTDISLPKASI
jgi:general secretion pathway protein J